MTIDNGKLPRIEIDLPCVPRKNEMITVNGDIYGRVDDVSYYINQGEVKICVLLWYPD